MSASYEILFLCVGILGLSSAIAVSFLDPQKGCGILAATLFILLGAGAIWFGLIEFLTGTSGRSMFS